MPQRYNFFIHEGHEGHKKNLNFVCFVSFMGIFSLFAPVGKVHTKEDECCAEKEPKGDVLMKQPPSKKNGDNGIEIDIIGGDNGTKLLQRPVPCHKTEHGGDTTKEEKVEDCGKRSEEGGRRYKDAGFGGS